jgi:molybdate transport system substrate-binding protein
VRTPSPRLVAAVSLLGVFIASCSSDKAATPGTVGSTNTPASVSGHIVVFAASSLTDAFNEMGTAFKSANPNATVTFNFAGSSDLVTQIGQGAPADIFVSADDSNMRKLTDANETVGAPVSIAKNTFQIIVEKGNPKHVTGVADLARSDLLVVLCADTVPCGKGAATILKNASVTVTPKSFEDKVKGVVTKVTAGEADAGIVFVTDVQAAGDKAAGVDIPANVNVISNYPMVVTKEAKNAVAAQAFIGFVAGRTGHAILAKYGFLAP